MNLAYSYLVLGRVVLGCKTGGYFIDNDKKEGK